LNYYGKRHEVQGMIPYDFKFYSPPTVEEAIDIFLTSDADGLTPMYFNGGTEFISRARKGEIAVDVVIDVKGIDFCQAHFLRDGELTIGSSITLNALISNNFYPLLSEVARAIATNTARNKITVGGNMQSHLPYKETMLPFLLANSELLIAGKYGLSRVNIHDSYNDGINL